MSNPYDDLIYLTNSLFSWIIWIKGVMLHFNCHQISSLILLFFIDHKKNRFCALDFLIFELTQIPERDRGMDY